MFHKDVLVLDIEATGLDFTKHELIQLAGVLLDKKTLKEKKHFNSYIRPSHWNNREKEAMAVNNITWDTLKDAPSLKTVLKKFEKTFGTDVILAPYGTILDTLMLRISYRKSAMKYKFDYHVFDVWPLLYSYMATKKLLKDKTRFSRFGLDDAAKHFKIEVPEGRHTALVDCRVQAEVLRQIIKRMKF